MDKETVMMSRKMLFVLLCTLVGLNEAVDVAEGNRCSFGWTHYKNRCFVYISCAKTWNEAQRHCQLMNANLASVHEAKEYEALRKVIRFAAGEDERAWIGGSDARKEGKWEWVEGSLFNYRSWCPNEPNNQRGEDCLLVNWKGNGCWNDENCDSKQAFVCVK